LYRFGGLYVDTDFELLQPEKLDSLHKACDFYCGLTPLDCQAFLINNAIIGSIPGHPILKACITSLKEETSRNS
jgi:mannosyltransferase OCH1-like enzyme